MDRVKFAAAIFVLSFPVATSAETVLLAPTVVQPASSSGDTYPESHFGQAPAPVETGISDTYAAQEAQEMDQENPPEASRSPAGLEFNESSARVQPRSPNQIEMSQAPLTTPVRREVKMQVQEGSAVVRKGVQEVALIAGDLGYFPRAIFVTRDIPVRLYVTGASKNTLCIMMDSFQVRKEIRSQKIEEITFTPSVPGQYRFHCPVNGMEGTMIVKDRATLVAGASGE